VTISKFRLGTKEKKINIKEGVKGRLGRSSLAKDFTLFVTVDLLLLFLFKKKQNTLTSFPNLQPFHA
jgi:hypothetical protein